MKRAQVLDGDLQNQLYPYLQHKKPMESMYYPEFIALNQKGRADNVFNKTARGEINIDGKRADVTIIFIQYFCIYLEFHNKLEKAIKGRKAGLEIPAIMLSLEVIQHRIQSQNRSIVQIPVYL